MNDITINDSYVELGDVAQWIKGGMIDEDRGMMGDITSEWSPIGCNADHPFEGEFDGNGFTISNLFPVFNYPDNSWGVFGYAKNAYIHDLFIENIALIGYENVGLVGVAQENVRIEKCMIQGCMTALLSNSDNCAGGALVGRLGTGCTVSNCLVYNYEEAVLNTQAVGGLCGVNEGQFSHCLLYEYPQGISPCVSSVGSQAFDTCFVCNKYSTDPIQVSGVTRISEGAVQSGYACYMLNNEGREENWFQWVSNINSNERYPHPDNDTWPYFLVYQSSKGGIYFNNSGGEEPSEGFRRIVLCDEKGLSTSADSIKAEVVVYIRDVPDPDRRWHTVCLPFELRQADMDGNYTLFSIDNIVAYNNNQYVVNLKRVDSIAAGYPGFVYKNDSENYLQFYAENQTMSPVSKLNSFGSFSFVGLSDIQVIDRDYLSAPNLSFYMLSHDAIYHLTSPVTIPPYHAFIGYQGVNTGAAPARLVMNVVDVETTGIRTLEEEKNPTPHYTDLMGRPIDPSTLGFQITNHKKLIVR